MNYIDRVVSFYQWMEHHPLPANAQAMYLYILYRFNAERYKADDGKWYFPDCVVIPTKAMTDALYMERKAMYRTRQLLCDVGLIQFYVKEGKLVVYILQGMTESENTKVGARASSYKPSMPSATTSSGSFETDEFYAAAVRRAFGDDYSPSTKGR